MQLPQGSKIIVTTDERGFPKYVLPVPSNGAMRIFPAVFLMAWLGGWGVGWWRVAGDLFKKGLNVGAADAFQIFWLIAWTAGGVMAILFLVRLLRPAVPETLVLNSSSLDYDTGRHPFKVDPNSMQSGSFSKTFLPKRRQVSLTLPQIRTLKLSGGRLTVDIGIERRDVGVGLTEVEKEWLFETVKSKYGF